MDISNAHRGGTLFEGTEGWVFVTRGGFEASPASLKDSIIGPNDVRLYNSSNHHRNFLECVRSRRDTITPIEVAHRSISIAHLGNIAMQLDRKVKWNPEIERFVDDPEADRKLNRAMRAPWRL
ncbi:MAG: hypothetical protein GY851_03995 [bacterium]|nr:hypothetical protein [bacterium]